MLVVVTVVFALLFVACSDSGSPAAKPATTRPNMGSDADQSVSKGPKQVSRIQGPRATPQVLEAAKAKKKCMEDKGWVSELDERTATLSYKLLQEQQDAYNKSLAECKADLEAAGVIQPADKPSDAELATLYDKIVEQTRCYEKHGYKTSEPPPSQRAFIDKGGIWGPEGLIPYIEGEELAKLDETCPSPR